MHRKQLFSFWAEEHTRIHPQMQARDLNFRLLLGLNIYYMGNRPTIMGYFTKVGERHRVSKVAG